MRVKLLLLCALAILVLVPNHETFACSGPGYIPPIEEAVESADLVVRARVLWVDDSGYNGRLEALTYYKGQLRPKQIAMVQSPPSQIAFYYNRYSGGGCDTLGKKLNTGETIYTALVRNVDGSYKTAVHPTQFSDSVLIYAFPTVASTVIVHLRDKLQVDGQWSTMPATYTEPEFIRLLETKAGTAKAPTGDYVPTSAPLLLTTTQGTQYFMPVDAQQPLHIDSLPPDSLRRNPNSTYANRQGLGAIGCDRIGCTAYSPNGLDKAVIGQDGMITRILAETHTPVMLSGSAFVFSPTSDTIVTWNEHTLYFYRLLDPVYNHDVTAPFRTISLAPVTQGHTRVVWQGDGRIAAYNDENGLYLIDVFSGYQQLLIPGQNGSRSIARYFSPQERYLAVTIGDAAYNIDLFMGERLPDGFLSLDDRTLLKYDTRSALPILGIKYLTELESTEEDLSLYVLQTAWLSEHQYMWIDCDSNGETCEFGTYSSRRIPEWDLFVSQLPARQFDYDSLNRQVVVVVDTGQPNRILQVDEPSFETFASLYIFQVDTPDAPYRQPVNLQQMLDGEIESAEWLAPIFYSSTANH